MHLFNKELICLIFLGVQAATLFFTLEVTMDNDDLTPGS